LLSTAYADGHFVFSDTWSLNPSDISTDTLSDQTWRANDPAYYNDDLAFRIEYQVVPEPTAASIFLLGLLVVLRQTKSRS